MGKSSSNQPKQAGGRRPGAGRRKGRGPLSATEKGIVVGLRAALGSDRAVARTMGVNRATVARVLTSHEADVQRVRARSVLLDKLPEMAEKLAKLNLRGDRQGLVDTMRGLQVFSNKDVVEHTGQIERTYALAAVIFEREKGRAPASEEELRDFDRTIELEPLVQDSAK